MFSDRQTEFSDRQTNSERERDKKPESLPESGRTSRVSRPSFWSNRKMGLSWYIKLNIMVMGFLFVLFLIKQTNTQAFKASLKRVFSMNGSPLRERSVRIKISPEKPSKKATKR